jgi:hypothetical protein
MLIRVNKNPSPKELRQFAWVLIIGFGLIGGLLCWRGKLNVALGMWSVGVPLGVLAYFVPVAAKGLYKVWMGWAFIMGTFVTGVILRVLFYFVMTPVALLQRALGRDALRLKKNASLVSYWSDHRKITDRRYYQRLF